jgi:hypothetical protein
MDYWNFRCRQPRFIFIYINNIEALACQFMADSGNGTVFQRPGCPARRTHAMLRRARAGVGMLDPVANLHSWFVGQPQASTRSPTVESGCVQVFGRRQ